MSARIAAPTPGHVRRTPRALPLGAAPVLRLGRRRGGGTARGTSPRTGPAGESPGRTPDGRDGSPGGITAGPDGALWFTELNGNRIGRITPAGQLREFPLPTAMSGLYSITAGP